MGFRVDPGTLGPWLYLIVAILPVLGVGAFCALYALFVRETDRDMDDPADQTPAEREASHQHATGHQHYLS